MVEGPGHVPLNQIPANVAGREKLVCHGAPFYVLGPLVTDIACGHDHITSAMGGALAAYHGVDFLCYVTPAEHLGLPDAAGVREGVIASRIAAHAGDVARGQPRAIEWDHRVSASPGPAGLGQRMIADSLDPVKAERIYRRAVSHTSDVFCTMCGEFCAMKVYDDKFEG